MYTLRPWMIYSEDPSQLMTINDQMIIGETTPAKPLFKQYMMVVREHKKSFDEELKNETNPVDQMTDEQLGQMIRDIANDSDSNIVDLFSVDKSKMH